MGRVQLGNVVFALCTLHFVLNSVVTSALPYSVPSSFSTLDNRSPFTDDVKIDFPQSKTLFVLSLEATGFSYIIEGSVGSWRFEQVRPKYISLFTRAKTPNFHEVIVIKNNRNKKRDKNARTG